MLFKSKGTLRYKRGDNGGYNLRVVVDQDISDYYRALIPKWIHTNRQMYPAHISVVRNEIPLNLEYWGKYEGEELEFEYENVVYNGTVYYWLNAFSNRLDEIRLELGLPVSSEYTRPPDGYTKCYHITIGNTKGLT